MLMARHSASGTHRIGVLGLLLAGFVLVTFLVLTTWSVSALDEPTPAEVDDSPVSGTNSETPATASIPASQESSSSATQATSQQVVAIPLQGTTTEPINAAVPPSGTIPAELITLRPRAFEPANITRAAGLFLLAINNRSGLENVTLRLDQVGGIRLVEVTVPRGRLDWRSFVTLPPGQYTLTEVNSPGAICRITLR